MTDINEWTLTYPKAGGAAVTFDFGLAASGFPFSTQVQIGEPDRAVADLQHGTENAIFMGRDLLGGRDLTFTLTTLPESTDQINAALDAASEFEAKWRAFQVARTPGSYALLKNNFRQRMVRGRPRNFAPKHDRMRRGVIEYVAQFRTQSPDFMSAAETVIHPVRTISTAAETVGDQPAFPIVTFTGKFTTASLAWSPGGLFSPWTITLNHALDTGDFVIVDTRPTSRAAYDAGGAPRNGWVTGTRMADTFMDPDAPDGHFLFTTTGATDIGTACTVEWFDTYAGL